MGYLFASESDDNDLNSRHCIRANFFCDSILDACVNITVTICTDTIIDGGKASQRIVVSGCRKLVETKIIHFDACQRELSVLSNIAHRLEQLEQSQKKVRR